MVRDDEDRSAGEETGDLQALPAIISCNGQWDVVIARLYETFCSIFKTEKPRKVCGRSLGFDKRILASGDGKEEGFWHVVSRGYGENREIDFRRAERLHWIERLLDGSYQGVSRFKYKEGSGKIRYYFWCENDDFVLILEENSTTMGLVTSFYVDRNHTKMDFRSKRDKGDPFEV